MLIVKLFTTFKRDFLMPVVDIIEHTDFFMPHSDLLRIKREPSLKAITPLKNGIPYQSHIYAYFHTKYKGIALMTVLLKQIKPLLYNKK